MTTEIAVANRLGIALATDSAVTITSGGRVKVFNTADKLFELTDQHSIAIMINGNMDCLGVPWEILVKDFRTKHGSTARPTVEAWGKEFLDYVQGHVEVSESALGGYVDNITHREIDAVQKRVVHMMQNAAFEPDSLPPGSVNGNTVNMKALLAATIRQRNAFLENFPIAASLEGLTHEQVRTAYLGQIEERMVKRFTGQKLLPDELSGLTDLVIESLLREFPSDFAAGVVIAGYGTEETFPAVFSTEVDGRVAGRLKVTAAQSNAISKSQDGGQVTYFAQTDVIERLLMGVDPGFVERTAEFIQRAVTQVGEQIEKATRRKRVSARKLEERKRLIEEVARTVRDEFSETTAETLKGGFAREFDRMIAMMPKQELIELAEALVSITAVERKATSDEGTVGGPIDVAFITKHEGFVWIKRKHYFESTLNPRYFWRKYSRPAA